MQNLLCTVALLFAASFGAAYARRRTALCLGRSATGCAKDCKKNPNDPRARPAVPAAMARSIRNRSAEGLQKNPNDRAARTAR